MNRFDVSWYEIDGSVCDENSKSPTKPEPRISNRGKIVETVLEPSFARKRTTSPGRVVTPGGRTPTPSTVVPPLHAIATGWSDRYPASTVERIEQEVEVVFKNEMRVFPDDEARQLKAHSAVPFRLGLHASLGAVQVNVEPRSQR
jgi:hypothetical protein